VANRILHMPAIRVEETPAVKYKDD